MGRIVRIRRRVIDHAFIGEMHRGIVIGRKVFVGVFNTLVVDNHGDAGAVIFVPNGFDIANQREMPLISIKRIGCRGHDRLLK